MSAPPLVEKKGGPGGDNPASIHLFYCCQVGLDVLCACVVGEQVWGVVRK